MAWMIEAGSVKATGSAASRLAIVGQSSAGQCGWRLVATHRTPPAGHPCAASAAMAQVWQDVLANLIEEESSNEQ